MAAVSSIVIGGALLAVAAGGAIAQANEARKARKAAETQANLQYAQQQEMMNQAKEEQKKFETQQADAAAAAAGNANRDASRKRGAPGTDGGLRTNVLTSPLGVQGSASTAGKTALGT